MPSELCEFIARPQEYLSLLDKSFYWIGENDCDSHIPLCVVLRPADSVNKRKRSAAAAERRANRPWYQGKGKGSDTAKAGKKGAAGKGKFVKGKDKNNGKAEKGKTAYAGRERVHDDDWVYHVD